MEQQTLSIPEQLKRLQLRQRTPRRIEHHTERPLLSKYVSLLEQPHLPQLERTHRHVTLIQNAHC